MIAITRVNLYEQMTLQKIVGIRAYDMQDNQVFNFSPISNANSNAINTCQETFKRFLNAIPEENSKLIVRLKKYHNTKEPDEIVYQLNLHEAKENSTHTTEQMNGQNPWGNQEEFNKQVDARVTERMETVKTANEVEELKKKLKDLETPLGRGMTVLGNIGEGLAEGVNTWARKNGYAGASTMQGDNPPDKNNSDDIEEATIIEEEKNGLTEEQKYEQAVQLFFDAGATGQFLLDVAKKVKQNPELLGMLANFLKIPKP